jgi:hypothetical protein
MSAFCLRIVLLTATALAYSSCAAPIVQRQAAFNEANFASTRGIGAASVVGQAFTVLQSNSVRYGRNVLVDLAAVTPYTTEIVERKLQHGQNLAPGDPRFDQFRRSAQADDHGNFEFHHLPPAEYYVTTAIDCSYSYWHSDSEGVVWKIKVNRFQYIYTRVSVKNGQTVRVTTWSQGYSQTSPKSYTTLWDTVYGVR